MLQPLDALTLFHLASELDVKLADGRVNKVQQASHHELLLHFWVGGQAGKQKLYINIRPEYGFCTLLEDSSFLTFPQKAPNFCMVLRKHLSSGRVKRVYTLPNERVLNLDIENYNELGELTQWVLSVELMGKNSNIILVDKEVQLITGCAHGVSEQMSRKREVSVGYPYAPPPTPTKPILRYTSPQVLIPQLQEALKAGESLSEFVSAHYAGLGKATLSDLFEQYLDPQKAHSTLMALYEGLNLYPSIQSAQKRYSLLASHQGQPGWVEQSTVNQLVLHYYLPQLLVDRVQQKQQHLGKILKAQRKKLQQRPSLHSAEEQTSVEKLKHVGDLLTIAASQGARAYQSPFETTDYETGDPVAIDLDPLKSLSENAQSYYKQYKKACARSELAVQQAEQTQNTLDYISQLESTLHQAASQEDLEAIEEDFIEQGWLKVSQATSKSKAKPLSKPLQVTSSDGFMIWVGKNGLQNDQLAGKLAKPHDIWLHTHLMPGSHVLIKTEKQTVPPQTLTEAALLAAYYSDGRDSVNVPVVYTEARYVRKIPNSYPGHVTYTHEQALNVTPEQSLINTLLG